MGHSEPGVERQRREQALPRSHVEDSLASRSATRWPAGTPGGKPGRKPGGKPGGQARTAPKTTRLTRAPRQPGSPGNQVAGQAAETWEGTALFFAKEFS